jgi:hypothetical protein
MLLPASRVNTLRSRYGQVYLRHCLFHARMPFQQHGLSPGRHPLLDAGRPSRDRPKRMESWEAEAWLRDERREPADFADYFPPPGPTGV